MFATIDVTLQFAKAGDHSLIASDTINAAITGSAAIKVTNGPAARLVLAGLPSSTVAGTALPVTVKAVDNHDNVVTDFAKTVHFASTDPDAQLPADFAFTGADAGSRLFAVMLARYVMCACRPGLL